MRGEANTKPARPVAVPFGVLGLPPEAPEGGRVDFEPGSFAEQIEAKGQRLAWTRAARCPCAPINDQSEQADPNCRLCRGNGWSHFGPQGGQDLSGERLDEVQRLLLKRTGSFLIRGLLIGLSKQDRQWDRLGAWRMGSASLTVRPANRLGYMDKLINLDGQIVFTEVIEAPGAAHSPLPTRYGVCGPVHLVRSTAQRFTPGDDFYVVRGRIVFLPGRGPGPGTRLAVHYVTYPTWIVQDVPNVSRLTNLDEPLEMPTSPEGEPEDLPLRATVRLEFLPPPEAEDVP